MCNISSILVLLAHSINQHVEVSILSVGGILWGECLGELVYVVVFRRLMST